MFTALPGVKQKQDYNGLRGGSKPRKKLYLIPFAAIQEGMETQQKSIDVIPELPQKWLH